MKRHIRSAISAPVLVSLIFLPSRATAQPALDSILYYEPIEIELVLENHTENLAGQSSIATANLSAFGRRFVAKLSPNRALIRNLPAATRQTVSDIAIWEGELDGIEGSWVRLVQRGRYTAGSFSDGVTTYRIEPFDHARDRLVASDPDHAGGTIVYQQSNTANVSRDIVVAGEEVALSKFLENSLSSSETSQKPVLLDGLELEIAVAADAEFAASFGPDANVRAIAVINDADALFVQQIGIHLSISELQIYTSEPDPFDATEPQSMLDEFESFASSTPGFAAADLAHLFTARSLGMNGSFSTIGIATLGGLCTAGQGVAISATGGGNVTAHEIAHNFGVPHDGEAGSACADEDPGYLMDPLLTGQSTNQNAFSACSIAVLEQATASASCLSPIPESDLVLSVTEVPTDVFGNDTFRVGFELDSLGAFDSLAIELTVDSPSTTIREIDWPNGFPGIECNTDSVPAICTFHKLEVNTSLPFDVFMNATEAGNISVGLTAWSLNDGDRSNNDVASVIAVTPAIELATSKVTVSPALATPGELVTVDMELANTGVADATGVEFEIIPIWEYFEFVSADLPGGAACSFGPNDIFLTCPVGDIPENGVRQISFVLRALDPGSPGNVQHGESFSASYSANEPDAGDGFVDAQLQVTNAQADLSLTMTGPVSSFEDLETAFSFTIENLGPDPADGMELTFVNPGMEIFFPGLVGCTISDDRREIVCPVPQLHAGENEAFTIGGFPSVLGTHMLEGHLTVSANDPELANNSASLEWSVVERPSSPPPSNGGGSSSGGSNGGGGGAMGPLWMLLVALTGLLVAQDCGGFSYRAAQKLKGKRG